MAGRLLGLWVRIPPVAWMSVCCECCVLSGRGLCFGPMTRPEESYRVWCVWVWSCSLDNEEALAHWGLLGHGWGGGGETGTGHDLYHFFPSSAEVKEYSYTSAFMEWTWTSLFQSSLSLKLPFTRPHGVTTHGNAIWVLTVLANLRQNWLRRLCMLLTLSDSEVFQLWAWWVSRHTPWHILYLSFRASQVYNI